jgi:HSP20 family protein
MLAFSACGNDDDKKENQAAAKNKTEQQSKGKNQKQKRENGQEQRSRTRAADAEDRHPLDVVETEEGVIVFYEIPGIEKQEDIAVQLNGRTLIITGEVTNNDGVEPQEFHRKERFSGHFKRTVALPLDIDPRSIKAAYKMGILEIKMTKMDSTQQNPIKVNFQ